MVESPSPSPDRRQAALTAAFHEWRAFLESLDSRFPDAHRGWVHAPDDPDHVVFRVVETAPGAEQLKAAVAAAEQRSLDTVGVSYTVSFEAKAHTFAEMREVVRELIQDLADHGPMSELGLTATGIGRDGIVLFATEGSGHEVLVGAHARYPGFEFELPELIRPATTVGFDSPEAAAAELRERLRPVLRELAEGRITPVEAIRSATGHCDDVLSCDLGVGSRSESYFSAQLVVLQERAEALSVIAVESADPRVAEFAGLASEVISGLREHGPLDHETGEPRRLFDIALRLTDLEAELGLTEPLN